jgi:hypothetical protein
MNERIRELAEQAGWDMGDEVCGFTTRLEKFAELVRADEREACAKLLENGRFLHDEAPAKILAKEAAKAIRARGEK